MMCQRHCSLIVVLVFLLSAFCLVPMVAGQSATATLSGTVEDQNGAVIPGAAVTAVNTATTLERQTTTDSNGSYTFPLLPPGTYIVRVQAQGFTPVENRNVVLNVGDQKSLQIQLKAGDINATVQVVNDAPLINESGAVGTVIDRQFVENLPMNGRSFNTLLQLTPGVLVAPSNVSGGEPGQFSVNGQRTSANNFQVDGVSANFGISANVSLVQAGGGGTQALSSFGGTSGLVSVDAVQEFRVETSSFAPEYGRTPGGQVIISTRSGTNNFSGAIFESFRNNVLDANNWFANRAGKPRAPERHNDFGGVLGGPIIPDRTFFFFSYEGLRLRQPQTQVIQVPSLSIRASAIPAAAAIFNAYPKPDQGAPVSPSGNVSPFTGSWSNPITMDALSGRIDHTLSDKWTLFGRFNRSPSQSQTRLGSLSWIKNQEIDTTTATVGSNAQLSQNMSNSLRFNYSRQTGNGNNQLDSLGGAVPPSFSSLLPSPFSTTNSAADFTSFQDGLAELRLGLETRNIGSQWNVVDDLSFVRGAHLLKFGVDYRKLLVSQSGQKLRVQYLSVNLQQFAANATVLGVSTFVVNPSKISVPSFSTYIQDRWTIARRLTLTYGVRWELNPAPSGRDGTVLASWTDVDVPASTALAPAGTPPWKTTYGNFAPRIGAAYQLTSKGDLALRGGWGLYYDLGTGIAPSLGFTFPNSANTLLISSFPVPLANPGAVTPVISTNPPYQSSTIAGFSPNLKLPYSQQWNVAIEKSFGSRQSFSVTYLGQAGHRLLRVESENQPNSNFQPSSTFALTRNGDTSNYQALQVQFKRPLSQRVQALVNYVWSRSIDTNSSDAFFGVSRFSFSIPNERGSSSFDVHHNFSAALTYEVPSPKSDSVLASLSRNWSFAAVVQARTGFPINIFTQSIPVPGQINGTRPDLITGQPIWLNGPQYPGGKALNPAAFALPSTPRQGTLGRNAIHGFGASQFDTSIQRKFKFTERVGLLFRADAFNVFNHPNFFNPEGNLGSPNFGKATQMLNQGLGGLNSLYQIGGPRSLQLSLKLFF
jgi:hypothetical protein